MRFLTAHAIGLISILKRVKWEKGRLSNFVSFLTFLKKKILNNSNNNDNNNINNNYNDKE